MFILALVNSIAEKTCKRQLIIMSDSSFDGELERMDSDTETETEYDTVPKDFDLKIKFKKENNTTYRVFEYRLKAGKNLPYKAVLKGE